MKIVFMGTPDFAVKPLEVLIEKYDVCLIVTQPDKEVGRKKEIKFSPVKEVALKNNIDIFQPSNIRNEYEEILKYEPDLIVTCAYGQIIPKKLLDYPKYRCINIHASLLPKYRGGAPIHRAIINGEKETGITIMYMDEKMDSGNILYQKKLDIDYLDDVGSLFDKLSILARETIDEFMPKFLEGDFTEITQNDEDVTYAYNISKEDELLSFDDTALNVYNKVRGLCPWPMSYAFLENKKVKIIKAEIGKSNKDGVSGEIINVYNDSIGVKVKDGEILITYLQEEGKKKMDTKTYLNGVHEDLIGKVFNK